MVKNNEGERNMGEGTQETNRTDSMTRVFKLLYGGKLGVRELSLKPGFKELMLDSIFQAKRELYHKLLSKSKNEITPQEVNIAYELSKDEQIQKYLDYMLGKIN